MSVANKYCVVSTLYIKIFTNQQRKFIMFAIMRHVKLNNFGSISASLQHNFRERETLNADPSLTSKNIHLQATNTKQAIANIKQALPDKIRKNAVLVVEYLFTASPEFFAKADKKAELEFFDKAIEFLAEKYGKENIKVATIQYDESTPHLSVFVVPLKDKKLNARHYLGGREVLRNDQTIFAEKVKYLGLKRGVEKSKATHTTVKEYYANIQTPIQVKSIKPDELKPRITNKGWLLNDVETKQDVANRLTNNIKKNIVGLNQLIKENQELKKENNTLKNNLNKAIFRTNFLSEKEIQQVRDFASKLDKEKFKEIINQRDLEKSLRKEKTRGGFSR